MPHPLAEFLRETINRELTALRGMKDREVASGWTPKQELGHLIDSAANNHIRIVVAAIEGEYRGPKYAQDRWVEIHGYAEMSVSEIVDLWAAYNRLIVRAIERISEEQFRAPMFVGSDAPLTLEFVIDDYVLHMQHHIDHLLGRDEITVYPRA